MNVSIKPIAYTALSSFSSMKRTLLIGLLFLITQSLLGQDTLKENYIKTTIYDHGELWKKTVSPKEYNYGFLLPLAVATGTSIYFDETISREVISFRQRHGLNKISNTITHFGDPYLLSSATLLAYGSGWIFRDSKLQQTSLMAAQAYIHNGIFTYLGKLAFARQRPFVKSQDNWHFFPYSLQGHEPSATAYQSFPSGHTSGIFAIATVVAKQYNDNFWIPTIAYSMATLTGVSRISESKHWLSDAIVGAALGYGIGHFVVESNKNTQFTLFPTYWENSVSLTLQLEI